MLCAPTPFLIGCLCLALPPDAGFLDFAAYALNERRCCPAEPYQPQPGDLLFFDTDKRWIKTLMCVALTGEPWQSGIVVRRPDGSLASFEAGPGETRVVVVQDLLQRLAEHPGRVWVRRRRLPLSCDESDRLTAFALAQEGQALRRHPPGRAADPFSQPRAAPHLRPGTAAR